jgi:hypothetical protein
MYQVRTVFFAPSATKRHGACQAQRIGCTNAFGLDILPLVLVLFAISIACFLALIGTAAAIMRHVRTSHRRSRTAAPPEPGFSEHLHAAAKYGTVRSPRLVPHQTVQGINAKKSWNTPSRTVEIHPASEQPSVFGKRQSLQPAHTPERADWAHFNKDFGDLTDPYTLRPRAASATSAAASKRF